MRERPALTLLLAFAAFANRVFTGKEVVLSAQARVDTFLLNFVHAALQCALAKNDTKLICTLHCRLLEFSSSLARLEAGSHPWASSTQVRLASRITNCLHWELLWPPVEVVGLHA